MKPSATPPVRLGGSTPVHNEVPKSDTPIPFRPLEPFDLDREPLPTYYTIAQVAQHLAADESTILAAIHAGELRAGKVGRRYLVLPSALADWLSRVNP